MVSYYVFGRVCLGLTYGYLLLWLAVSVELVCYIIVSQSVFYKSVLIHRFSWEFVYNTIEHIG